MTVGLRGSARWTPLSQSFCTFAHCEQAPGESPGWRAGEKRPVSGSPAIIDSFRGGKLTCGVGSPAPAQNGSIT
jgi:hypothetical protein